MTAAPPSSTTRTGPTTRVDATAAAARPWTPAVRGLRWALAQTPEQNLGEVDAEIPVSPG